MNVTDEALNEIPNSVMSVVAQLRRAGFETFLVGGCVRDMLRRTPPKDYDIASAAVPEQVISTFKHVIPTGIKHGTVTVMLDGEAIEVTTFRSEGAYSDGRRPDSVKFETDIVKDLSRRDFTMNAMALNPFSSELIDPFGGLLDLDRKIIRCVGSPMERFAEDGLRVLRAVRFATTIGCTIDYDTFEAIRFTIPIFRKVAVERMVQELNKIMLADFPGMGIDLMRFTGLLEAMLPTIDPMSKSLASVSFAMNKIAPISLEQGYALLLHFMPIELVKMSMRHLKMPTGLMNDVLSLVKNKVVPGDEASDHAVRLWIKEVMS